MTPGEHIRVLSRGLFVHDNCRLPCDQQALCRTNRKDNSIHVHAYVKDGELHIDGQDMGKCVEEFFGRDEYEYFLVLKRDETDRLYDVLKVQLTRDEPLLMLVKAKFSGASGFGRFQKSCEFSSLFQAGSVEGAYELGSRFISLRAMKTGVTSE